MADIKQAAKWMSEGKDVVRHTFRGVFWVSPHYPRCSTCFVVCANGRERELSLDDLMAEDWELV